MARQFWLLLVLGCTLNLSVMTYSPEDWCKGVNPNLRSCYGNCGLARALPCSCDTTCSVLKKCCEDFADVCPNVLQQSLIRYKHVIGSEVTCTEDNLLAISSCPKVGEEHSDVTSTNPESFPSNESNRRDVLEMIKNAPVYDVNAGLLYVNPDVYSCYADDHSVPVQFSMAVRLKSSRQPVSYEELNDVLDFDRVYYSPPSNIKGQVEVNCACYRTTVNTCQNETLNEIPEVVAKCEEGPYSPVVDRSTSTFYKNMNCLECSIGKHGLPCISTRWQSVIDNVIFFVVPYISETGSLRVVPGVDNPPPATWREVICNLSGEPSHPDQRSCAVETCNRGYELRPDGLCKAHFIVLLGLVDKDYNFNDVDMEHLPEIISCFAREHLHLSVDKTDPVTHHSVNDQHNGILHYASIEVFVSDLVSSILFGSDPHYISEGFIQLSAVIKTFICQLKRRQVEEAKDRTEMNNTLSCFGYNDTDIAVSELWTDVPAVRVRTTLKNLVAMLKLKDFEVRGSVVSNETVITCFCAFQSVAQEECIAINCLEDALYENDVVLMEKYEKSPCFSVFQVNVDGNLSQVNEASARVIVMWLMSIMCLLVWVWCG